MTHKWGVGSDPWLLERGNRDASWGAFWGDAIVLFSVVGVYLIGVPLLIFLWKFVVKRFSCTRTWLRVSYRCWAREALFRRKVNYVMRFTKLGDYWLILQLLTTVAACGSYVIGTYFNGQPLWLFVFEVIFTVIFTIDYVIFFYIANNKVRFVWSFFPLVDFLTVVPVYISLITLNLNSSLRVTPLRVLRALRIVRVFRAASFTSNAYQRQGFIVLALIACLCFISTALIQIVEDLSDGLDIDFHEYVYFIVVTFTTVGYGDISPITIEGKMVMTLIILVGFFLVPWQIGKFMSIITERDKFGGTYSRSLTVKHVVVTGDVEESNTFECIREFLHQKNYKAWQHKMNLALLMVRRPLERFTSRLRNPRLSVFVANHMEKSDYERVSLGYAKRCFILVDQKHTESLAAADNQNLMRYLIIKGISKTVPTTVQFFSSKKAHHSMIRKTDTSFSVSAFSLGIMGTSCFSIGCGTMLSNLMRSYAKRDVPWRTSSLRQRYIKWNKKKNDKKKNWSWQEEYFDGCMNEVFTAQISDFFIGKTFGEAVVYLFEALRVLLLGMEVYIPDLPHKKMVIAPLDAVIEGGEQCAVVAMSQTYAHIIEAFDECHEYMSSKKGTPSSWVKDKELKDGFAEAAEPESFSGLVDLADEDLDKFTRRFRQSYYRKKLAGESVGKELRLNHRLWRGWVKFCKRYFSCYDDYDEYGRKYPEMKRKAKYVVGMAEEQPEEVKKIHGDFEDFMSAVAEGDSVKENDWRKVYKTQQIEFSEAHHPNIVRRVKFKNHILVIGWREEFYNFIQPLRRTNRANIPIVIFDSDIPPPSFWIEVNVFPDVFFVQGTPLSEYDLQRAGISKVSRIILIPKRKSTNGEGSEGIGSEFADQTTLLLLSKFEKSYGDKIIISLLEEPERVNILQDRTFMTGLSHSAMRNIMSKDENFFFRPIYTSGRIFSPVVLNSLTIRTLWQPDAVKIFSLILFGGRTLPEQEYAKLLWTIDVPKQLIGKEYRVLLTNFLRQGLMPMGLYRKMQKAVHLSALHDSAPDYDFQKMEFSSEEDYSWMYEEDDVDFDLDGAAKTTFYYPYTNPYPETVIFEGDRVYVLSAEDPNLRLEEEFSESEEEDTTTMESMTPPPQPNIPSSDLSSSSSSDDDMML